MAGLHFDITGDNSNFMEKLRQTENGIRQTSKKIEESGLGIEDMFGRISKAAAGLGAAFSAQQFASQVMKVRGEFQQLEVAFNTMLGSAEKSSALMQQLTRTAAITPFGLQDVAGGAKQLLAYGVASEEVNDTLIRLGDIAAGLSIPLNDLVYLYGTTMTQGRMFTQDLRQFQGRGIPLADELAKQFGVTKDKVGELVTAGKVGFDEMHKAIVSMTSDGGKFGGLMEAQSKTITGQISNIEDAIDNMFNEIGKSSEGIINTGLGVVSTLVENYEKVGEAIGVVVAAYGTYKAAIMLQVAMQRLEGKVMRQAVVEKQLAAAANIQLSNAQAVAAARTKLLMVAQRGLLATLKSVSAATLANPYVLLAAAIAAVGYATYKVVTSTTEMERAQERVDKSIVSVEKSVSSEVNKLNELQRRLKEAKEGSDDYKRIKDAIVRDYGKYYDGLDKEIEKVGGLSNVYEKLVENMRLSAGQRGFLSFFNAEQDNVDKIVEDKLDKAYSTLIDKYGKTEGLNLYNQFFNNVMRGEQLSSGAIKKLREATFFDVKWGGDAQTGLVDMTNDVNHLRTEINMAKEASKEAIKTYQEKYNIGDDTVMGILTGTSKEITGTTPQNYKKSYEAARNEWETAKAELKKIEKDKEKYTTEQYEAAKEREDTARKEYEKLGGVTKTSNTQESTSDRQKEIQEKLSQDLLAIQQKNIQDEIALRDEGKEKKLAQIDAEYDAQKKEIEKKAKELAEANKEAGAGGLNGNGLTDEQQAEIDKANRLNEQSRDESAKDVYREELQALYDYLKEYGTIQQQKYAIAKEYDEKIAKEQDANRKKMLQKEKENAIASADAQNLAMGIDWGTAFEGVGNVLKEVAQQTLKKVEAYMQTAEFKGLSAENKRSYVDLRDKLNQETGGTASSPFNFKQWGDIAKQATAYQDSVKRLMIANQQHEDAVNKLKQAEEDLASATDDASREMAQKAVDSAKTVVDITAQNVRSTKNETNENQRKLTDSTSKATQGLSNFASYLNEMNSGSLYGFANGITKLITSLSRGSDGIGKSLAELGGKIGGIVGAILQILEALGDDPRQFIDELLARVASAVEGILSDLPQIIITIVERVVDIVGGILGGIGSWFGLGGESDPGLEKAIERLTATNETLQYAIDELTEVMEKTTVADATDVYEQQKAYLKQSEANTREMMDRAASASNSGFLGIGGHHSSDYKINKGMNANDWARISKIVNRSVREADDFFSLTSEQMAKVARDAPELYGKIKALADDGYKDAAQFMDEYIQYYKQLEELENEYREKITGSSFESVRDEFKSALLNMESTAEDFAKNFEELMKNAIVESFMTARYDQMIQDWYKEFATAMEGGTLDTTEKDSLKKRWDDIVTQATAERDALFDAMGFDDSSSYSQEASSKGFAAMSQDTGEELNGRFTALQISNEEIKVQMIQSVALMTQMLSVSSQGNVILNDILVQHAISNGYLEDLVKYSKTMMGFGEKIDKIIENTQNL